MTKNDEWWASLTIAQKEHIAVKIVKNTNAEGDTHYPGCSALWISLEESLKQSIHDHCTDAHGMITDDWQEGKSLSY